MLSESAKMKQVAPRRHQKSRSSRATPYVGRGHSSVPARDERMAQRNHCHISHIARQADTIAAPQRRFRWKSLWRRCRLHSRLALQRQSPAVAANSHLARPSYDRLESRVHITPLFFKLDDPDQGPHVPAHTQCPRVRQSCRSSDNQVFRDR